jgi:MYXO-CTERM domain-containing protein
MHGDVDITSDDGRVLATLSRASVNIFADPVINMNFNVQAANQNTIFTVTSGLLSFPTINGAIGAASAGVTVTDVNGDGGTLAPDGADMYRAHYNGQIPGGTLFTTLLGGPVSAGAFQSGSATDEFPGGGNFVGIGDPVTSMSAQWSFTVSAFDLASGSSTFIVVPTPAGAALLGVAGLVIGRRRR